mgnify:FL=1
MRQGSLDGWRNKIVMTALRRMRCNSFIRLFCAKSQEDGGYGNLH